MFCNQNSSLFLNHLMYPNKPVAPAIKRLMVLLAIILLSTIFLAQSASTVYSQSGKTIYVASNGNNGNPGSENQPLKTIQKAVSSAVAGDTIYVRSGTYHETVSFTRSGAPGKPIRLLAYPNEQPVIDGQYTLPAGNAVNCSNVGPKHCFVYAPLVGIRASHIEFSGFKIIRSRGRGITVDSNAGTNVRSKDITINSCIVDGTRNAAINIQDSTSVTVQNCEVSHGADFATHSRQATVLNWPVIVNIIRSDGVRVRNSIIRESWGEGIAAGRDSKNVTIEDNIIYDNYALQVYIHRTQNVTVQRNLIYHTNNPQFRRGNNPSQCIVLNNEANFVGSLSTKNITIKNNVITGCKRNISIWGSQNSGLSIENVEIANNTLVNAKSNGSNDATGIDILGKAVVRNVNIHHNVIHQPSEINADIPNNSQIKLWSNAWDRTPPTRAVGSNDYVGNLGIQNPNQALVAGAVNVDGYKLKASSQAKQRGIGPYEYYAQAGTSNPSPPTEPNPPVDDNPPADQGDPVPTQPSGSPVTGPTVGTPDCSNSSIAMVFNNGFDSGDARWQHHNSGQGSYRLISANSYSDKAGEVTVRQPGNNIQLYQSGIKLEKGEKYRISFYARSSSGRDMNVIVHQHNSPYRVLGLNTRVNLTSEWKYFSYQFVPQKTENDSRLRFWLTSHAKAGDTYAFDQVVIAKVDASCSASESNRLDEAGLSPNVSPSIFVPFIGNQ